MIVSIEQDNEIGRRYEMLRFQAHPSRVSACRCSALAKLCAWKTPVRLEDVELLVGEIVINAILYGAPVDGADPCVGVESEETVKGLLVWVRDKAEEHSGAEFDTGPDDPDEVSRPCDVPMIPRGSAVSARRSLTIGGARCTGQSEARRSRRANRSTAEQPDHRAMWNRQGVVRDTGGRCG